MSKRMIEPKKLIELITIFITLITAIIGLYTSLKNKELIDIQKKRVDSLFQISTEAALRLSIDSPFHGEAIKTNLYKQMYGTLSGRLPDDYSLWVFAKDDNAFFLQRPPISYSPINKRWSQSNIKLDHFGQWELHICIANKKATEWAREKLARNIETGSSSLPDGFESIGYRVINRE